MELKAESLYRENSHPAVLLVLKRFRHIYHINKDAIHD